MAKRLSAHFVLVLKEALLKSFWRKPALKTYLRSSGVDGRLLGQLSDSESKRNWLDFLIPQLEDSNAGQLILEQIARDLASQRSFPDLMNWEDTEQKLADAKSAVAALEDLVKRLDEKKEELTEAAERRKKGEEQRMTNIRSLGSLATFKDRLDKLAMESLGTSEGGYAFEKWFYEFMDFCEIENRKPYKTPDGRQIDGAITIDGTTYHGELKFEAKQTDVTAIDSILSKVEDVHDNTMAILVSMGGVSEGAKNKASKPKSPLLLFDHSHVYLALGGSISFADIVRRVRRHGSHEGKAYLSCRRIQRLTRVPQQTAGPERRSTIYSAAKNNR